MSSACAMLRFDGSRASHAISPVTIGKFKFAFLPLLIVGCGDEHSFHYDYQGRLLNPDGSAAANVELYVTHLAGLDFVHSSAEQDREFWKYWGTTTDQGGRFHGE